ncbi:MAG: carbohydrate binding family 9 domain-containing protein [Acidobacteriota bacterium]|nr:MAG: carbohydrate binding family 9 domain-containing protein [Acidobacteriota bacterium]
MSSLRSIVTGAAVAILLTVSPLLQAAPAVRAVFTSTPPKIDGQVDTDEWAAAEVIDAFLQREPVEGAPASELTEVRILYDQDFLYFGFRCFDSEPDRITAKELARDADLSQDDRVQIIIETFLDRRNGYWFQIGPRGSIGDALVSDNGSRFNKQWDGLWAGRAQIRNDGWHAEVALPFKTLSFSPGQTTWGLKLLRHIKRKEERVDWPSGNLNTYTFQISDSGDLEGLEGISQGIGLDLRPYGLLGHDHYSEGDDEWVADAGLDLFYQLTPGLKAAVTLNTDFAETEVDSRRINLTRFPLFFPEKRDFFLDGSNYFTFGPTRNTLIPFFSRRLGLDSNGNPIPIIAGGKLTGQQGSWNLGIVDIVEDREGNPSNSFAARVTHNLFKQSSIGAILTSGNSLGDGNSSLIGADFKLASSEFRGNRNIELSLWGLKSFTEGLTGRDTAEGVQFLYPNDFLNLGAGFQQIEENFVAGIGFVPRSDIRESYVNARLGPRPGRAGIRQVYFGFDFDYITNLDNRLLTRQASFIPLQLRFDSGDTISTELTSQLEYLEEDFQIHPDHLIGSGQHEFHYYRAEFQTARRRNLWFSTGYRWGSFFDGRRTDSSASVGYKVAVPLYLEASYERNRVDLPDGAFTVNVSRLNANVLFSPDLTLYSFLQYDNLSKKMGWQSRFYWILKPGNEIILVWNSTWRDPLESVDLADCTLRFKINYNYRF